MSEPPAAPELRTQLADTVDAIVADLGGAHAAREAALPACRSAIRASGSSIRALHRLDPAAAAELAGGADASLRRAQDVLAPYPAVASAGFLADAEKELVEAVLLAALIAGQPLPGPGDLRVDPTSWMKGLAEAASELRRHTLDRLRDGDLARGEELLEIMDDVFSALVPVDYPDALTGGLRRTLDALRAVLERTRGDVTTTVLQVRLQRALEQRAP